MKMRKIRASYTVLDAPGNWKIRNIRRKLNNYRK